MKTYDFRILWRQGPGDRFVVVQRAISSLSFATALEDAGVLSTPRRGDYLVQEKMSLDVRLYRVEPTIVSKEI